MGDVQISADQLVIAIVAALGVLGATVKVLVDGIVKRRMKDSADIVMRPELVDLIHALPTKEHFDHLTERIDAFCREDARAHQILVDAVTELRLELAREARKWRRKNARLEDARNRDEPSRSGDDRPKTQKLDPMGDRPRRGPPDPPPIDDPPDRLD